MEEIIFTEENEAFNNLKKKVTRLITRLFHEYKKNKEVFPKGLEVAYLETIRKNRTVAYELFITEKGLFKFRIYEEKDGKTQREEYEVKIDQTNSKPFILLQRKSKKELEVELKLNLNEIYSLKELLEKTDLRVKRQTNAYYHSKNQKS